MASPEDYYHTMAMFDGPWYECQGPTKNEALELVKTHMEIRNKYFLIGLLVIVLINLLLLVA